MAGRLCKRRHVLGSLIATQTNEAKCFPREEECSMRKDAVGSGLSVGLGREMLLVLISACTT